MNIGNRDSLLLPLWVKGRGWETAAIKNIFDYTAYHKTVPTEFKELEKCFTSTFKPQK